MAVAVNNTASKTSSFIEANTLEVALEELKGAHIIPVFHRDNEPLISQADFIETTLKVVENRFRGERIQSPSVRVSHPIKGRTPEARNKPACDLLEGEKTLFYERMMFVIEVPSIRDQVGDEELSLIIGGIKCYSEDNLGSRKEVDQHFKLFIGFKVSVCTNLCVFSDGLAENIGIRSLEELQFSTEQLISSFDAISNLKVLQALSGFSLSGGQFAHLIGKCKLYQHLPSSQKEGLPAFLFGEQHLSAICREYYTDASFSGDNNGDINLWKLYNLLTAANKSSYIDSFLSRGENASLFVGKLSDDLGNGSDNWFLS